MDIFSLAKDYLKKMICLPGAGMKILLVDEETLKTVSLVSSMSEIMKQEVYLVERLDSQRVPLNHLYCVCFLRPTKEVVYRLCNELRQPKYMSYFVFFSHTLTKQLLKQLAEADEHEVVQEVHEYFLDFLPLNPFLFELDIQVSYADNRTLLPSVLCRCTDALTSLLLSLKICPVIRYQNSSEACRQLAESVRSVISREVSLFDFKQTDPSPPVLLIIDRRSDAITPLLTQWTYEAMIHELIGIRFNRINLSRVPNIRPDLKEVTLSREYDEFFRSNQFSNYGEIGQAIRSFVDSFQAASKTVDKQKVDSISDLKNLLEHYPSFRKASGTVETHVTIITELSRLLRERALLDISQSEQELACHDSHSTTLPQVQRLLADPRISLSDALRLVLLYALRYENQRRELSNLVKIFVTRGGSDEDVQSIQHICEFAESRGVRQDQPSNPFGLQLTGTAPGGAVAAFTKRLVKGLQGIENVYTQHEPTMKDTLGELIKGRLKESSFPCLATGPTHWSGGSISGSTSTSRSRKIVVFFIGGTTFEEAHTVHKLNATTSNVDIILGGTYIHNSRSFIHEVCSASKTADHENSCDPDSPPEQDRSFFHRFRKPQNVQYHLLK